VVIGALAGLGAAGGFGSRLLLAWVGFAAPPPALPADPFVSVDVEEPADVDRAPMGLQPSARTHGRLRARVAVLGARDWVEGATVFCDAEAVGETDAEGELVVWLEPGSRAVEIRAPGFEPHRTTIDIELSVETTIEFRLERDLDAPRYYTLVEADREVAVASTRLSDDEIHALAGTRGDPFGVVKSLPGTSQVAGFLPYVVVRGAAPGNTGYVLDNVRVPLLFHVAFGPAVIHPMFIDSVDFHPGGAPVRLGRFTNGVIEGNTKKSDRSRVRAEVDVRFTDVGGMVEVPINRPRRACADSGDPECEPRGPARGSIALAGRYSYSGLLLSAIPGLNAKLAFWDYQARLDHDLGPRARYTAFAYGSYDEIGPARTTSTEARPDGRVVETVDEDPDPFLRLEFHRIDQRVNQRFRRGLDAQWGLALGLDRTGVTAIRSDEWRVAPRAIIRKKIGSSGELAFGLDQEFQIFKLGQDLDQIDPDNIEDLALFLGERFVSTTGLWADWRWHKGRAEVRPGIRLDAYTQVGASAIIPQARSVTHAIGVDPRLLVRQRIDERWTLRQAAGVYHQPPAAPIPLPGIESLGFDRGLQRNVQGSFGYERTLGRVATLQQELYVGRLSNLQDYEFAGTGDESPTEIEDFVIRVTGWAYGLESQLRIEPGGRAFGWVSYTLSRSTRSFVIGGRVPSTWDQTHILNAVLGWRWSKWLLSGRAHFNTGRPYTSRAAGQDLIDALRNNRNDGRLPPFFQLDARVERVWTWARWRLHLTFDVTNATLSREIFGCGGGSGVFGYGTPSGSSGGVAQREEIAGCVDPQGIRYVLPSLGLRGVF
jgi:hypothetical protein